VTTTPGHDCHAFRCAVVASFGEYRMASTRETSPS